MSKYEVEARALLGSEAAVVHLKKEMADCVPPCIFKGRELQKTHYFEGGDITVLPHVFATLLTKNQNKELARIAQDAHNWTVRTREGHRDITLIIKTASDGVDIMHGSVRREFEGNIALSLEDLDEVLLGAGFKYQSKWSRTREIYHYLDISVCIDLNAGYGYVVEIEKIVQKEGNINGARESVISVMETLGVEESSEKYLQKMFEYYVTHWEEYYGTKRIFTIKDS